MRHRRALQPLRHLLPKALNSCIKQEQIIKALFEQLSYIVNAALFIEVVHHDDLIFLVFVGVELGNELVCFYPCSRKVQCLSDVELLVLLRLSQIDEKEIRLYAHGKLLSANGDRGEVRSLRPRILLGFVPVVDRLSFLLLVDEFPEG